MFDRARLVGKIGERWAAYERGVGRPVLLLPGVWDLAATYRALAPVLAQAGHRVVALDLPGHGESERWGRAEITAREVADSLDEVLGELGVDRALVVGHDAGARFGRELAARHPARVAGLVALGTLLSGRMPVDPRRVFEEALGPEFFLLALEEPGPIEALLERDVRKTIDFFHRAARSGASPFSGTRYALFEELRAFEPARAAGRPLHDEGWRERYVEAFERTGFGDALAMLRPVTRNWEDEASRPERVDVPVTFVLGEEDGLVPPSRLEGFDAAPFFPRFSVEIFPRVGHFPQLEASSELSAVIVDRAEGAPW